MIASVLENDCRYSRLQHACCIKSTIQYSNRIVYTVLYHSLDIKYCVFAIKYIDIQIWFTTLRYPAVLLRLSDNTSADVYASIYNNSLTSLWNWKTFNLLNSVDDNNVDWLDIFGNHFIMRRWSETSYRLFVQLFSNPWLTAPNKINKCK